MAGLSDKQQAIVSLVSAILIALAGVSIPAGLPLWVALVFALLGAIGFALKEYAGTSSPVKTTSQ